MATKSFPILIFADGASSGNPGPGGWGAIVATPDGSVTELGGGVRETTNNQMELMGVIRALETLDRTDHPIQVLTDSVYVIRGITQWSWGWRKNGWKTGEGAEVANQDLWRKLIAVVTGKKIAWGFVRGHAGIPGNERCDEIAVAFSKGGRPSLYRGPLLQYGVAIHDIPESTELPAPRPKTEAKPKAFSYLSLVGSTPMRHETWLDCERRVKGVPGAKFKKAMSESDQTQILQSWGVDVTRADLKDSGSGKK